MQKNKPNFYQHFLFSPTIIYHFDSYIDQLLFYLDQQNEIILIKQKKLLAFII